MCHLEHSRYKNVIRRAGGFTRATGPFNEPAGFIPATGVERVFSLSFGEGGVVQRVSMYA
jgi:hypothetical protein